MAQSDEGFTPGPWTVRTLENFGFNVVHYNGGDKFDIVRVAKCGDEANARLIAAAPKLFAALVMLEHRVGHWFDGDSGDWQQVQTALAEVRGHAHPTPSENLNA